jgi:mannose-1-phosphate guanylyltransferase
VNCFVLGAGLGKRLRPLTNVLPKPLVPVWHRPLITWAFDHLRSIGASKFVVNTHHLPEAYPAAFPDATYDGLPIEFRHEPVLLETGGGLANVWDLLATTPEASFAVYNGDILCDVDLRPAWEQHLAQGNLVTLVLRADGATRNVAFDTTTGRVLDLRNALQTNAPSSEQFQFTGIYFVHPDFYPFLKPGEVESVVEGFLRAIQAGRRIGGVIVKGDWWDMGDIASYQEAHAALPRVQFPKYASEGAAFENTHASAKVAATASLHGDTCVGPNAQIGDQCELTNCLVWPNATVPPCTQAASGVFYR